MRKLLPILTSISLSLFVMFALLWVRGLFVADFIIWAETSTSSNFFVSAHGGLGVWISWAATVNSPRGFLWQTDSLTPLKSTSEVEVKGKHYFFGIGGFTIHDGTSGGRIAGGKGFTLIFLDGGLCAVTAILPIRWLVVTRKMRKLKSVGRCAICGYDLRASPDRCPECGTLRDPNVGSALADGK